MNLNKTIIVESVHRHDLEAVEKSWETLLSLIEQNPFSERICFLLTNQEIARVPVENKHGERSAPNCIGTAFFVASVGTVKYPYHAYEDELDIHMLHSAERTQLPGAFIFSYSACQDGWHAGIYLGKCGKDNMTFAQDGHGGNFSLQSLARNYSSPYFYIPSTLSKVQRS